VGWRSGYSGFMNKNLRFSTGTLLVSLATVLAVVLAAGFVAVFFFDVELFGTVTR
jgi:hypothetical protein